MAGSTGTHVVDITSEAAFDEHTRNAAPTTLQVIYFHAPWAEPCKQMSSTIASLASNYAAAEPATVSFLSIDAEEVSEVSERYNVTQVPFIVLQRGADALETISGGDAARVRTAIEKHSGQSAGDSTGAANSLPPAQHVTPRAPTEDHSTSETTGGGGGGGKSLAAYAPGADAPATAPEYSSGEHAESVEAKEKLQARLAELVKAAPVMLFIKGTPSAPQCGFSRQTVSILRENGVRYGFFNILADDEVRQGLKDFSDWPTFPQVYVGGELIGGLDILKEEFESDPNFLDDYKVSRQRNTGGPAAPEQQATPA